MEAIGTLAGGIAHDFNNILVAIIGFSEIACDKSAEGSPPSSAGIRATLPGGLGFVLADRIRIQQMIINLCSNAAHATKRKGGGISIDLADVTVTSPGAAPDPAMNSGLYAKLSIRGPSWAGQLQTDKPTVLRPPLRKTVIVLTLKAR
jgi:signal transduction histidine kinase